jgi:uncharacterized protein (DUF1501 family)
MLTIVSGPSHRTCDGLSRRDFVQAGALALGGLTLPWLLRSRAAAAAVEPKYVRDRAVVLVFLGGGASQIETFNPNMGQPEPYRSVTGEVKTPLAGVTLGGTFPRLAKLARRMAIVRSFRHPIANHPQAISHVLTGGTDPSGQAKDGFSMGSMYARLRGANHPRLGMPTYHLLLAPHKDRQYGTEMNRVAVGSRPGPLGASYGPFTPAGKGAATENMRLKLPAERLGDRRELLRQLDGLKRGLDARDAGAGYDQFEQQAVDLLLGGASKAFDLTRETKATQERYDTGEYSCGKKVFEPSILGKQMLLARRLVEAGAGLVTVQSAGWDMHADGNNPGIKAGMEMLGRPLDKALSAFLEDIEDRGLSEKVLVVLTGDFGRTPRINKNGGRDHWANLCTLAFWGGGLKMGQVIGACDKTNGRPTTAPYSPGNLLATVMNYLFDVGTLRVTRGAPGNLVKLVEGHRPIAELF